MLVFSKTCLRHHRHPHHLRVLTSAHAHLHLHLHRHHREMSTASASTTTNNSRHPSSSATSDSCNVTERVRSLVGRNLHRESAHPITTVKNLVHESFNKSMEMVDGQCGIGHHQSNTKEMAKAYELFDSFEPIVTTKACFDDLLVPKDHVSRSYSDTFYIDEHHVLRTHTSAHQTALMRQQNTAFLVAGDCYRRDEIDAQHYPCFHQMEGVRLFHRDELPSNEKDAEHAVVQHLKSSLQHMVSDVFAQGNKHVEKQRWIDAYFPFTHPSVGLSSPSPSPSPSPSVV